MISGKIKKNLKLFAPHCIEESGFYCNKLWPK